MKKAKYKRLHILWFLLYKILENANEYTQKAHQCLPVEEGRMDYKETFVGDTYVHYLHCSVGFMILNMSKLLKLYTLDVQIVAPQ